MWYSLADEPDESDASFQRCEGSGLRGSQESLTVPHGGSAQIGAQGGAQTAGIAFASESRQPPGGQPVANAPERLLNTKASFERRSLCWHG